MFYEKPWARIPAYLLGVVWGCSYFTYKHEQRFQLGQRHYIEEEFGIVERTKERNLFVKLFHAIKQSTWVAIAALVIGCVLKIMMVQLLLKINNAEGEVGLFVNMCYLLLQRPVYCFGSALAIMPFILKAPIVSSLTYML